MQTTCRVGVAVAVALACIGCSSDDTASTTATEGATTSTLPFDPDQVEDTYLAFEAALQQAGTSPVTPDLPELQAHLAGQAKDDITRELSSRLLRGEAERPGKPAKDHIEILGVYERQGQPVLVSCKIDDRVIYDTVTDEVTDADGRTYRTLYTLDDESGTWKIVNIQHTEIIEQATDCAALSP